MHFSPAQPVPSLCFDAVIHPVVVSTVMLGKWRRDLSVRDKDPASGILSMHHPELLRDWMSAGRDGCRAIQAHSHVLLKPASVSNQGCVSGSPSRSRRILARTSRSATHLLTCRPRARPSGQSTSSAERRSWSARFPSSLLASPSRTTRTRRVPLVRALAVRVLAAAPLGAVVGAAVGAVAGAVVV